MPETVDVVVIGMGFGGAAVASNLAQSGLSVVGIDESVVGDAPGLHQIDDSTGTSPALPGDTSADGWGDMDAVEQFTDMGGLFVRGVARLAGQRRVAVDDGREFSAARAIVISDGTQPRIPAVEGLHGTPFWMDHDVGVIEHPPESLIVLGGGPTGLERAQGFARLGTRVDVVEVADRLIPSEEPEAGEFITEALRGEGIGIHTGVILRQVEYEAGVFTLDVGGTRLTAERLLMLPGRSADIAALGVDTIGLDARAKHLDPDDRMRVADGVYAMGDITGKGTFAHIAMYQAAIATNDILGNPVDDADHAVPRLTFTDPEVGSAGLTEEQARAAGFRVRTGAGRMPRSPQAIDQAGDAGMIKLVEDADRGVLIDVTAAGPSGGEVPGLVLVARAQLPTQRLRQMTLAYPSFQSAIEEALSNMG